MLVLIHLPLPYLVLDKRDPPAENLKRLFLLLHFVQWNQLYRDFLSVQVHFVNVAVLAYSNEIIWVYIVDASFVVLDLRRRELLHTMM